MFPSSSSSSTLFFIRQPVSHNFKPFHLEYIYIYLLFSIFIQVTLSSSLFPYRHSTLTPLHFYPNPSPSFQFRPRKIFFFLHFNFHFFSSILPFLFLPSYLSSLPTTFNLFYFLDLSILVTRSTHSPSSVPPSFVHRSFPLSSPDTPSASSLPVLPFPFSYMQTVRFSLGSAISHLLLLLSTSSLPIRPTRFRPTFSSRRIDRAESASPIPAYVYRVLYYYAVHPVYSPDAHGDEPRPFFGRER